MTTVATIPVKAVVDGHEQAAVVWLARGWRAA